ncbi:outer membrane beta-barrel family protein [Parapedobacter tibetensis]|uniref:outer membrane beta-barrel family protein n=1 Tax=Parapedobacter tibetensis TaxID=2972951 RepID=UPI00214D13F7|nr:outer membrane beta-barrel family protein [Parapedobacter tibetensis]
MLRITHYVPRFPSTAISALALALICSFPSSAQTKRERIYYGHVLDSTSLLPLDNINISLFNDGDSTKYLAARTIKNGRFEFSVDVDSFTAISFTHIGYRPRTFPINEPAKSGIRVYLEVLLSMENHVLDSVSVTLPRASMERRGDTVIYDVSEFKYGKYDDADIILFQIPGVYLNHEGELIAQGTEITKITVDGSDFFLTDPLKLMKIIPAEAIDKVKIVNARSPESDFAGFDDGLRYKQIDIVTKPDKRTGYFGQARSQLGTEELKELDVEANAFREKDRYASNISLNNISRGWGSMGSNEVGTIADAAKKPYFANLDLNYSNERDRDLKFLLRLEVNNNAIYNRSNSDDLISVEESGIRELRRSVDGKDNLKGFKLTSKLEYRSNKHSLMVIPGFELNTNKMQDVTSQSIIGQDNHVRNLLLSNNGNYSVSSPVINGMYSYKIDSAGRSLSLTFTALNNFNNSRNNSLSTESQSSDNGILNSNNYETTSSDFSRQYTMNVQYNEPLNQDISLQTVMSISTNRNTNEFKNSIFNAMEADGENLGTGDNVLLAHNYRTQNSNSSFGFRLAYSKPKMRSVVGMYYQRYLQANTDGLNPDAKERFTTSNYLPFLNISFAPRPNNSLSLNYTKSVVPPSLFQLQEATSIQDPQRIALGNSHLKNEVNHQVQISNNYILAKSQSALNTIINLNINENKITDRISYLERDTIINEVSLQRGARISQPVNVNGYMFLNANTSYTKSLFNNRVNTNFNLNFSSMRNKYYVNEQPNRLKSNSVSSQLIMNFFSLTYQCSFSYQLGYQHIDNSLASKNLNVIKQVITNTMRLKGITLFDISSNLSYYGNKSSDFGSQDVLTWNISLTKSFLKDGKGLLSFSIYDLFDNNNQYSYNVNTELSSLRHNNVLGRFYMFSLAYQFRRFGL